MICIRCGRAHDERVERCVCGYTFAGVVTEALPAWYEEYCSLIEAAYLPAPTPWQQSGQSGTYEEWARLRIPICEAIERSGSFLDIGCANGFLLECLRGWTKAKGLDMTLYGLDLSPALIKLARERLSWVRDHRLTVGNALDWTPPLRFDYVRTSLEYVPRNWQRKYLTRLLDQFLTKDGVLLVAQYRSRKEDRSHEWIDDLLQELGFHVDGITRGFDSNGLERTRVAIIKK